MICSIYRVVRIFENPYSDLLPLVIITLVIGYVDKDNYFVSSEVKFATAVSSIIPLSYYIGMGIAR